MQDLQVVEVRGMRVLTTKQIAEAYGTDIKTIQYNFRYNKARYELGVHYIEIKGDELRRLKTTSEIHSSLKYAKRIYLWTEKGALLHAKSLNTDKAWEVYDYLVDFYFRAKGKQKAISAIHTEKPSKAAKEPYDIAPLFREFISYLPLDALDAMEKAFRVSDGRAIKLATVGILAEKMKRQLA